MSMHQLPVMVVSMVLVSALGCGSQKPGMTGDTFIDTSADTGWWDVDAADDPGADSDAPVCVDGDGDGHGPGCAAGGDCDDADPAHWSDCSDCAATHAAGCACSSGESWDCYEGPDGTADVGQCGSGTRFCEFGFLGSCVGQVLPGDSEVCGDGVDNDCNGAGDEEVMGSCGDCDPSCHSEGDVEPDPSDPYSDGIMENPDGTGGVVLGSSEIDAGFAWIANSEEGTVSKLRLSDGVEVGRYYVGLYGSRDDQPSRTAVDSLGNAYVASRAHVSSTNNQPSVAKLAGDERYCVDRNSSGTYETSTGPAPLPLGEDECVIWRVPVGNPGGIARALAIDFGEYEFLEGGNPWVGMYQESRFLRLDPDDGHVTAEVDLTQGGAFGLASINPYGAAIDPDGKIWASEMRPGPGYIQRFDPETLAVDPPVSTLGTGCETPAGSESSIWSPYGIAVAPTGRVWVGSWSQYVCGYDPAGTGWTAVALALPYSRGVAADSDGWIWASNYDGAGANRIVGFDAATPATMVAYDIAGVTPIGVGVDELGQVWTVNQGSNTATRLVKATGEMFTSPVGSGPYTYSDFTGYQRSLMMPQGTWVHTWQRCAENPDDHWGTIDWNIETPPGSRVTILGLSADTEAGLASATQVTIATIPPDTPTKDITAAFAAEAVYLGTLLRIVVVMEPSVDLQSPVLRSVDVNWHCSDLG